MISMSSSVLQLSLDIPTIPKKIYEFYKNQKFTKMSDYVEKFIFHLDSSSKNTYQIEEINFISEICVKACKKLIKQRKIDHRLTTLTSELTSKYSNSTRIVYLGKLNLAQSLIIEGKYSEAKDSIKSTLKVIVNYPDCSDLSSKLLLTLSEIYLKQSGKHEKSLKYSQRALDQCFKKINSSHETSFFKCVIEALYLKGLYYVKIMDFKQAETILDKIKEISSEKTLCKHLNASIQSLGREITSFLSRRSTERSKTRMLKHSGTFELSPSRNNQGRPSFTIMPMKSIQERERNRLKHESNAALKIQSFFRMINQKKKYIARQCPKVLCTKKTNIYSVEYIISASINYDNDIIIQAIPIYSGVNQPKNFCILYNKRKEYGVEETDQVNNLLDWVSIVGDKVFVPHILNKKRLIFKTSDNLNSERKFIVKVFETVKMIIVQACDNSIYEISLEKNSVPEQFIISPTLLVKRVTFEYNKLFFY